MTSILDHENRVIYLTKSDESIGPDTAGDFCQQIDYLTNLSDDEITIKMICIDGGCWYSGMAMYRHIKSCPCYVTIKAFSLLCSMGTVLLQAADSRLICPDMEMMVHFGSTEFSGEALAVKTYADFTKNSSNKLLHIYAEKCKEAEYFSGQTQAKVASYLRTKIKDKGDWWMNAEEAIMYGFADDYV